MRALLLLAGLSGPAAAAPTPTLGPEAQALELQLEALLARAPAQRPEDLWAERGALRQARSEIEAQGLALLEATRNPSDQSAAYFTLGEVSLVVARNLAAVPCDARESCPEERRSQALPDLATARAWHQFNVAQAADAGVVNIWVDLSLARVEELDAWTRRRAAEARYQARFAEALACEASLGWHLTRPASAPPLVRAGDRYALEGEAARCLAVYTARAEQAQREALAAKKQGEKWGEPDLRVAPAGLEVAFEDHEAYVAALRDYRAHTDARLQLHAAELFYAHGHLEEARARLEDFPFEGPEGEAARRLLENILRAQEDLEGYLTYFGGHLYAQAWPDFDLGPGPSRLASLAFLRAQALREAGALNEAALVLMHFAATDPSGEEAGEALYFAIQCFERTGEEAQAQRLRLQLIALHPDHPSMEWLLFQAAQAESGTLQLEEAIAHYEQLVREHPDSRNAPAALINAGFLRVSLGQHEEAAQTFERYARDYSDWPDAEVVAWLAVLEWREVSDEAAARATLAHLQRYPDLRPEHAFEALRWLAEHAEARGELREAERSWNQLAQRAHASLDAGLEMNLEARQLGASAELRALERSVTALESTPPEALREALQAIEVQGQALLQRWPEAAEPSLVWLARAEAQVAQALRADCPEDCAEDIEALEERRTQRLEAALAYSRQAQRRTAWTEAAGEALNALEPGRYAPAPDLGLARHGLILPPRPDAEAPPSPASRVYLEGLEALEAGDAERALERFERSVEQGYRGPEPGMGVLAALALAGRAEEAMLQAKALIGPPEDPRSRVVLNNLAQAYLRAGELDMARLLLQQALRLDWGWKDPTLLCSLAWEAQLRGEPEEARDLLTQVLREDPEHVPALLQLAELCAAHWQEDEARALLERALALEPEAADLRAALAALAP
ncbi:MAG: tetratricopeptide repeat protein [Alphaproteobacteria bacterium]|nr:tetratricopeptide repeat protein [Alphaproteobacteria bacterium]